MVIRVPASGIVVGNTYPWIGSSTVVVTKINGDKVHVNNLRYGTKVVVDKGLFLRITGGAYHVVG